MQTSDVRRRVKETIGRAKRAAAERRAQADEAVREYQEFLDAVAIPLFRQVADALRAEGHPFSVFTPAGGVRLMSDRSGDDFIELLLDTANARPQVVGHSKRARGRRIVESEAPIGQEGPVRNLTEDDVLTFVLRELEPLVER
jgi:hypothetical protein